MTGGERACGGCSAGVTEPFALRVLGDSMEPEFSHGHIILVDPGHPLYEGAFVVVDYGGEVLFGRYRRRGEREFVEYLNPAHKPLELIPPYELKGVVIERVGRRRRDRKQYGWAAGQRF